MIPRLPGRAMGLLALVSLLLPAPRIAANVLADNTFETNSTWGITPYRFGGIQTAGQTSPVTASSSILPGHGTIDVPGSLSSPSSVRSTAAVLTVNAASATGSWGAGLSTGWITVNSPETELAHLNLAFDLWTSHPATVRVKIDSYITEGSQNVLAGSRHAYVTPPVQQAFFRHSLDLSKMLRIPVSSTALAPDFAPTAKWIVVTFEMGNGPDHLAAPWPTTAGLSLRLDNIAFSSPKYYVDTLHPAASDSYSSPNNGRSLAAPFRTVQRAIDAAVAGDVIMVRNGNYPPGWDEGSVAWLENAGSPSRWITLRAYPGHTPVFEATSARSSWNLIRIQPGAAYIEIRGITGRGRPGVTVANGQTDLARRVNEPGYIGSPIVNGNGFSAYGDHSSNSTKLRPHHLRFIDNHVYQTGGGGMGAIESDYVTIQGNLIHDTSVTSSYATSGISLFHQWNFHHTPGHRNFILNNTVHSNSSQVGWILATNQALSDGNGIIIDDSRNTQTTSTIPATPAFPGKVYLGRTLIANNLAFNNGGGGIQIFKSDRVDVINNTAYHNGSVQTDYGEIYVNQVSDVRVHNNIMWARAGQPINVSKGTNSNVAITHNVFARDGWNPNNPAVVNPTTGAILIPASSPIDWGGPNNNNIFTNPQFVSPSTNPAVANFRLQATSPARDSGLLSVTGAPRIDRDGFPRPIGTTIDRGAHEYAP